jgi:hypothetical protein
VHYIPSLPGGKLILSPTGPCNRDFDDVRVFASMCFVSASLTSRCDACGSGACSEGWLRGAVVVLTGQVPILCEHCRSSDPGCVSRIVSCKSPARVLADC